MNESIRKMVDYLFRNCEETEEVLAAREEITNNCEEHYQDLIQGGMSETEALRVIADSLSGMEELVNSYPQRDAADSAEKTAYQQTPEYSSFETQNGCSQTFSASGVDALEFNVLNHDLVITPSADGEYHILCDKEETADTMMTTCQDGLLKISFTEPLKRSLGDSFKDFASDAGDNFRSLDDVPVFLRKLGGLLSDSFNQARHTMHGGIITIEIPERIADCKVNSTAGDVTVGQVSFQSLKLQSVAGDLKVSDVSVCENAKMVSTNGDIKAKLTAGGSVETNTISGDIRLHTDCGKAVNARSTSGDIRIKAVCGTCEAGTVSGNIEMLLKDPMVYQIKAHTISGNALLTLPENMDMKLHMTSQSGKVRNHYQTKGTKGSIQVEATSVSGNVEIN